MLHPGTIVKKPAKDLQKKKLLSSIEAPVSSNRLLAQKHMECQCRIVMVKYFMK